MNSSTIAILATASIIAPSFAANDFDPKTEKTLIQMMQESPNAIPLDARDPTLDVRNMRRDPADNPERKPGPINIQKTVGGLAYMGIPTFFRLPVALGPEDLKAGKVDVAFFGASVDMSTGQRGTCYGPQAVRTGEVVGGWGEVLSMAHPVAGDVDFTKVLNCVDYGDAPIDILSAERSILPVYEMALEIAQAGTMPVTVGGDHSLMYPDVAAITEVYGKGNVAVLHFDAHFDGIPLLFGHYLSHGAPVRRLIDEGHVKGEHFIQIGLNSVKPGADDLEWMRTNKMKYHFMSEIDEKGWKAVMDDVLKELEAGPEYLFISIDTDCLDPAFAPGMGTPEPGGMTLRELFPMLRAAATARKVVGIELVEVNPVADPTYRSGQVAVRILRETLTGVALHEKGIRDPYYIDPKWKHHGAAVGQTPAE